MAKVIEYMWEMKHLFLISLLVLKRIIDSQEENGYVGATARSYRSPERPVRGMDAYELYFVFHAFITVYEETGDREALTAAEKLADYPIQQVKLNKVTLTDDFWLPKIRTIQEKTIRYAFDKCESEGRLENFVTAGGYYTVTRAWKSGDSLILNFPMQPRTVVARQEVKDDAGKFAVEYVPYSLLHGRNG